MTCQNNEILLNNVLIQMACSFLQYVGESWPWVSLEGSSIELQVRALAARQRQNVGEIVALLTNREQYIDFGSFPTEYTDQQFLSLEALASRLKVSQKLICDRVSDAITSLATAGDAEGAELLKVVDSHENHILKSLGEIERDLAKVKAGV